MKMQLNITRSSQTQDGLVTPRLAFKNGEKGSALITSIIVVAVVTTLVGVSFVATSSAQRTSDRARDFVGVERAAEAAVEYGYGIWKQRIFVAGRPITTAEVSANLTGPTLPGYTYLSAAANGPLSITATDQYGAPAASGTQVLTNLPNYPGWNGFASSYLISAKMMAVGNLGSPMVAGVRRRFQYIGVPLFQAMYFFQDNMEFYKPATMIVSGLVHTNSNLWASSSSAGTLTFSGNVSYSGNYSTTSDPPYANTWSGWSANAEITPTFTVGQSSQVSKVAAFQPLGNMASLFNTTDSNPNNDGYQELIQMPNNSYSDPLSGSRYYNTAGVVMQINGTTATVTTQNGTTATAAQVTAIKNAFKGKTTIYDQREGKNVDVANIDVSVLTPALNSIASTGFNGVIYVVDTTAMTGTNTNPKTVRLQNGGVLPDNGLTVASQNPVYVQGDYNTGTSTSVPSSSVPANATGNPNNTDSPTAPGYTRKPAAVIGDAVMLLSNAWSDSNASASVSTRNASNTTFNMALMGGYMPSGYTPSSGAQYGYSGGAPNFPRFLEDWSGNSCTYYGSMVELFQSQVFTGKWDTGNIYVPPYRRFNFDTNYSSNPPPGGTTAFLYSRGSWSKF